jgi:hypothetical protein
LAWSVFSRVQPKVFPSGDIGFCQPWPLVGTLKQLALAAGEPVLSIRQENGLARLHVGEAEFVVNLTGVERSGLGPYEWQAKIKQA